MGLWAHSDFPGRLSVPASPVTPCSLPLPTSYSDERVVTTCKCLLVTEKEPQTFKLACCYTSCKCQQAWALMTGTRSSVPIDGGTHAGGPHHELLLYLDFVHICHCLSFNWLSEQCQLGITLSCYLERPRAAFQWRPKT